LAWTNAAANSKALGGERIQGVAEQVDDGMICVEQTVAE